MQELGQGSASAADTGQESATWQARCAVLSLLGSYLQASPQVQRLAVRKWNVVAVLFGLLWEQRTQRLALDMVGFSHSALWFCL